jgi:hypothetical protein
LSLIISFVYWKKSKFSSVLDVQLLKDNKMLAKSESSENVSVSSMVGSANVKLESDLNERAINYDKSLNNLFSGRTLSSYLRSKSNRLTSTPNDLNEMKQKQQQNLNNLDFTFVKINCKKEPLTSKNESIVFNSTSSLSSSSSSVEVRKSRWYSLKWIISISLLLIFLCGLSYIIYFIIDLTSDNPKLSNRRFKFNYNNDIKHYWKRSIEDNNANINLDNCKSIFELKYTQLQQYNKTSFEDHFHYIKQILKINCVLLNTSSSTTQNDNNTKYFKKVKNIIQMAHLHSIKVLYFLNLKHLI